MQDELINDIKHPENWKLLSKLSHQKLFLFSEGWCTLNEGILFYAENTHKSQIVKKHAENEMLVELNLGFPVPNDKKINLENACVL